MNEPLKKFLENKKNKLDDNFQIRDFNEKTTYDMDYVGSVIDNLTVKEIESTFSGVVQNIFVVLETV